MWKASPLWNHLLWWSLKKKRNPQNKVWLGNHRSNTHTHTHTHMDSYSMRTHTLTICGTLRHSFTPPSLSHTCIHTNLHSLIWADSGNRSSELARGPGRGGGVEGGWEGDQREDENSRLAEKKQQKKKERRKESFEREEKRKENFLCCWALRIQEREEIWNPSI